MSIWHSIESTRGSPRIEGFCEDQGLRRSSILITGDMVVEFREHGVVGYGEEGESTSRGLN